MIDDNAPKKLIVLELGMGNPKKNGTTVIKIRPPAIIKFADINPNPYNAKIRKLFFGVFEIPKDQKRKIALSSQGKIVCRKPKIKAISSIKR